MAWTKAGPGRPKGLKNKRSEEAVAKAKALGVTPLDVMLEAMKRAYDAGNLAEAHNYAKDAAPYVHARLQSVESKNETVIRRVVEAPTPAKSAEEWLNNAKSYGVPSPVPKAH